jgi:hypothetical protein
MDKVMELLTGEGGLLRVRGGIALVLVGVTAYMWANGDPVPPEQLGITSLIVGNYFGARFAA